ncbi:RloB family protein [Polymorphospora rubra]|uniref:RloB family protein n=1 Tax=Polymorphospora rubra TaxID=338584 RepID=UPI003411AA3D
MPGRSSDRRRHGFSRETDLRRRPGTREQRTAILIATNGESTERDYFLALKAEPWVRAARVAVVFKRGAPIEVIRDAARRRDHDDYDQAWAVCDVDHYETATADAEAIERDVRMAWSNPCFEVWLILHKADCNAHLENARRAGDRLRSHVRNWNKTALDYADGVAADRGPSTTLTSHVTALSGPGGRGGRAGSRKPRTGPGPRCPG